MSRISLIVLIVGISTVNALFFGGGGGGGCCCQQQQSCGCGSPPPAPSCGGGGYQQPPPQQFLPPQPQGSYAAPPPQYQPPPPPQSSYAAPPPQYQPPPPQNSYAAPPQQQFAPPANFQSGCQPRYIIVRPVEQVSHPESPIGGSSNYQTPVEPAAAQPLTAAEQPAGGSYKTGAPYKSVRASKTVLVDARCNSAELRQLLEENIVAEDANESKRRVHKAANEQFANSEDNNPQGIDVICAPGAFSYRIATDFFCEHAKANITCFAYQQHIN